MYQEPRFHPRNRGTKLGDQRLAIRRCDDPGCGIWLLVHGKDTSKPMIDGHPVPFTPNPNGPAWTVPGLKTYTAEPLNTLRCDTLIYVETRNVTFNLPSDLMRQAKIYAAEHDTTVNALVRELLDQKVTSEARTRAAADRFLELAERGPHSPVDPASIRREELYERW